MAPGASSQPSHSQLTPHGSLTSQHSNSLPSTPRQNAKDAGTHSRTPSPRFGGGALSPRSVSSESNRAITSVRSVSQNCRYQWTKPALRRIPYTIGSEPLERPSTPPKESLEPSLEDRLSTDMRTLYEKLLPSDDSQEKRKTIVFKLEKILREEFPGKDVEVSVFGSSGNLLFTSESDVDICIVISGLETVCTLAEMLARRGMKKVQCVHAKAVPIVKIWDPQLELACDLNVNNLVALKNTQMVRAYIQLDDRVRPLAMIIKYWSKRRKINEASGGTLSSYTWTLLIINFLQLRSPPILPVLPLRNTEGHPKDDFSADVEELRGFGHENHESLGALMFQFFRRYGYEMDYESAVVSVRQGNVMTKKEKRWHIATNNRLCVEEPFNTDRNLGNTADDTAFRGLHLEIRQAFTRLSEAQELASYVCEQYEHPAGETRPAFERPNPQPRPILSRSASQSGRLARTPNGSSRSVKGRLDRGNAATRRASNPANFGFQTISSVGGMNPTISGPGFYGALQQPRTGIHDQLNRLSEQLTAQENHLRYQQLLMSQFQLQQALISGQQRASQTSAPAAQQRGVTNGYSTSRHPISSEGSGIPNMYVPPQFNIPYEAPQAHTGAVSSRQGNNTHPSSPSIAESTPSRRPPQRSSTPNSPGQALRSQSQPARSVNAQLMPIGYTGPPYAFLIGHGSDRIISNTVQSQSYVDAFGRTWNQGYGGSPSVAEPVRREYLGYGIGDSPHRIPARDEYSLAQIPSYEDLQRDRRRGSPLKQQSHTSTPVADISLTASPTLSGTTVSVRNNIPSSADPRLSSPTSSSSNLVQQSVFPSKDEPLILNGSYEQNSLSDGSLPNTWTELDPRDISQLDYAQKLKGTHSMHQNFEPQVHAAHTITDTSNINSMQPDSASPIFGSTQQSAVESRRLKSGLTSGSPVIPDGRDIRPQPDLARSSQQSAVSWQGQVSSYGSNQPTDHRSRFTAPVAAHAFVVGNGTLTDSGSANGTANPIHTLEARTNLQTGKATAVVGHDLIAESNRHPESAGTAAGTAGSSAQMLAAGKGWQQAKRKGKRSKVTGVGQVDPDSAHVMTSQKDERKGG